MKISKCKNNKNGYFQGPCILEPEIYSDERGLFFESWNKRSFDKLINQKIYFIQDNQSISRKGVLRGMHYQLPPMEQGKLVRCSFGSVYDVIVDLRKNSSTYSLWSGIYLNSDLNKQLWIPPGFAHGFLSLEEGTIFEYKVTNYWSKNHEKSLSWKDPVVNIVWPSNPNFYISDKDNKAFSIKTLEANDYLF
tara:strand:+ start:457 stop:1032 length:576 start_codon:yes stop_codon:yes gene_type:complete